MGVQVALPPSGVLGTESANGQRKKSCENKFGFHMLKWKSRIVSFDVQVFSLKDAFLLVMRLTGSLTLWW